MRQQEMKTFIADVGFSVRDSSRSTAITAPFFCLLFFLLVGGTSSSAVAEEIVLGAAVSLREPVEAMVEDFLKEHPDTEIRIAFGASSTLARQIEFGAPMAIFLSADPEWIEHLARLSLLDQGESFPIASNQLLVVKGKGSELEIHSPSDLGSVGVERVALPPESVPLGRYVRRWLEKHALEESVQGKAVITEHARATLVAVENGHADVAIVYKTDALRSPDVDVAFEIPSSEQPSIVYSVVRLRSARSHDEARELLSYLKSRKAEVILEAAGFSSASSSATDGFR